MSNGWIGNGGTGENARTKLMFCRFLSLLFLASTHSCLPGENPPSLTARLWGGRVDGCLRAILIQQWKWYVPNLTHWCNDNANLIELHQSEKDERLMRMDSTCIVCSSSTILHSQGLKRWQRTVQCTRRALRIDNARVVWSNFSNFPGFN